MQIRSPSLHVVIGLGVTGLSVVKFLNNLGVPLVVADTREVPPLLEAFRKSYPDVLVYTGEDWPQDLIQAKTFVLSPGVALSHPFIQRASENGAEIIGDIELFARYNKVPVVAITGSNGKSTVTQLVGEMAERAGKKVAIIGNIGTPVLDSFLNDKESDLIVMELSSFQLETTLSLKPLVATVLNVTPDHMDRYDSFLDYAKAKHRIHHLAKQVVINKQDPLSSSASISPDAKTIYFTLDKPQAGEYGLSENWLCLGEKKILSENQIKILGKHNVANVLSAFALGAAAGLDFPAMIEAVKHFSGLPHRCQHLAEKDGISWVNDSKGTNVGASVAAINGIGASIQGKIILLLGGDGKGADFSELAPLVRAYCKDIIVMGKDTQKIISALKDSASSHIVTNMQEAVQVAARCAQSGDVVLLSPACASLDQYRDYKHRGDTFKEAVQSLLGDSTL